MVYTSPSFIAVRGELYILGWKKIMAQHFECLEVQNTDYQFFGVKKLLPV
jgi:hypothetical protein